MIGWEYIAGFVDGEGSVVKHGETDYRVSIPQTHEGVLLEIKKFTGAGNIFHITKRKAHWKECWLYTIARQSDVLIFLKKVYPYLIVKKPIVRKTIPIVVKIVADHKKRAMQLQKTIKACKLLRVKKLSYRAIGKKLNIDHGYARRMVLFK